MRRRTSGEAGVPVLPLSLPLAGCAGTAEASTVTAAGCGQREGPVTDLKLQRERRARRLALLAAGPHGPDLAPVAQA